MPRDVDQRLTALPTCPALQRKLEVPANSVSRDPEQLIEVFTKLPKSVLMADVWLYAIVLAAVAAAAITGTIWFLS